MNPPSSPPPPPVGAPPTLVEVYRQHAPLVENLLKRRVREQDLADLMQTSFMEIERGLPTYDPVRPIQPWIATIVHRTVNRHFRRLVLRLRAELVFCSEQRHVLPSGEARVVARDQLPRLCACLKDRQLEVVLRIVRDEEPMEVVARDLGISTDGGYKLLNTALAKLEAAEERFEAIERRQFGRRRALVLPFGLLPRVQAWTAQVRAGLTRALLKVKAVSASLGAGTGVAIALGAVVVPGAHPCDPAPEVAPTIAVAFPSVRGMPAARDAPAPVTSTAAPLGPQRPRSPIPRAPDDPERRSLDSIEALLRTDPTAARVALDRHKKAFPHELLAGFRLRLESLVTVEVNRQQGAQLGAAPP